MKFADLKKKSADELNKELDTADLDLMRFNAKVATAGIGKESGRVRETRRKIARIKTIQRQNQGAKKNKKN
jgi:ribosomal protein L29